MNKLTILLLLLLSIGCTKNKYQSNIAYETKQIKDAKTIIEGPKRMTEPYDIKLQIVKEANNKYYLKVSMELYNGSSFISPFETKKFTGKFYMDLGSYKDLSFNGNIIETPRAVARYDSFKKEPVIWVHQNTNYKQALNILSQEDFEVFGRVIFTIEPRCTLENIPFVISYQNGEFTVKKNPGC
jgi:hypothetical protein